MTGWSRYRDRVCTAVVLVLLVSSSIVAADEQAQIDFANGLYARGFNEDAAAEYRAYLKDFPTGAHRLAAWFRLGECEAALGRHDAALEAFDKALEIGASDEEFGHRAGVRKGAALIELGRVDDAVAVLTPLGAAGTSPEVRGPALYYLGKAHFVASRLDDAVATFSQLAGDAALGSYSSLGHYQLGFVYLAKEDLEKAAVAFSEVANAAGAGEALRMESRFRAAEVYDKLGWFDAAVRAYGQLSGDFPGSRYAEQAEHGHAWALYHAGKVVEAIVAARGFIKAYPESGQRAGVEYLLGNCLQHVEKYDDAREVFAALQASYPGSNFAKRAQYKEAWVLYLDGDATGAESKVNAFLVGDDDTGLEGDGAFLLATILYDRGELTEARTMYRRVVEDFPGSEFSSDALFRFGECSSRLGESKEAADAFAEFAKLHGHHTRAPEAMLRAGDAHFELGEYAESIARYGQVIEAGTGAAREEAMYRLAVAQHNQGEFSTSAASFERLVEDFPESGYAAEANVRSGDYWLREGGEPVKAVERFKRALELAPKGELGGRALQGLALARYESKDFDGAAQGFVRLMRDWEELPLNEKTYAWVGQHLFDREEWEPAALAFASLLRHVPDYPNPERVRFKIAECAERSRKIEEAIRLYGGVVAGSPRGGIGLEARYRMAQLHEERGEIETAMMLYEEGAGIGNGEASARSRFRLGELLEGQSKFDDAAKQYLRIAILYFHPELSPESMFRAGRCFEEAGDGVQARKTYEEVVRDYPDSAQAASAQARLAELSG